MAGKNLDSDNLDGFSEINITPFVDVVLVLLVIFMVAAPVMVKTVIDVKLPTASQGTERPVTTLGVVVLQSGQILLNGKLLTDEALRTELIQIKNNNEKVRVLISADTKTEHGNVINAIDILKESGIEDFAFQVEKKKSDG